VKLARGTACLQGKKGVDKIDAKLTRGEAVLPVKTVKALGARNIAATIKATNDGKNRRSARGKAGSMRMGLCQRARLLVKTSRYSRKNCPR